MPGFIHLLSTLHPHDTIPSLEDAAERRYWDGFSLATEDDRQTGAVYLVGYVAEMLIKTAYYRFRGIPPGDDVSNPKSIVNLLGASWPTNTNFHALVSWAKLLIDERAALGSPMSPALAGSFLIQVQRIYAHWRETLRYVPVQVSESDLIEVHEAVEWIRGNHRVLWS